MLSRLQSDCEYYLGYGNRTKKHLYYGDEKEHIEEMKKLYEKLPVKPEWLAFEKILEYEKLMVIN
jgi:NAD(P)H-flavin reductase